MYLSMLDENKTKGVNLVFQMCHPKRKRAALSK